MVLFLTKGSRIELPTESIDKGKAFSKAMLDALILHPDIDSIAFKTQHGTVLIENGSVDIAMIMSSQQRIGYTKQQLTVDGRYPHMDPLVWILLRRPLCVDLLI